MPWGPHGVAVSIVINQVKNSSLTNEYTSDKVHEYMSAQGYEVYLYMYIYVSYGFCIHEYMSY